MSGWGKLDMSLTVHLWLAVLFYKIVLLETYYKLLSKTAVTAISCHVKVF